MSRRKAEGARLDPFAAPGDLAAVADEIYGASDGASLDTGRVVARPTPLNDIWADVRQPRRAIPASIRNGWNGNPADVEGLLRSWYSVANSMTDKGLDLPRLLRGEGEGLEIEEAHPLVQGYVQLGRLAQDIRRVGLSNPISVIRLAAGRWMIESGERRWLAYHLLRLYDDAQKWAKVPAIVSDGRDFVWRQASENTARRALNAIGMARQLALLIMDSRAGEGISYNSYSDLVVPGGCDRRYYAQVANGNVHRIPKGMGERIQAAMGLSMAQLSHYRNLLRLFETDEQLNDVLWTRADIEDWPEKSLREIAATFTPVKVWDVVRREEWTLDDLRRLADGAGTGPTQQWGGIAPTPPNVASPEESVRTTPPTPPRPVTDPPAPPRAPAAVAPSPRQVIRERDEPEPTGWDDYEAETRPAAGTTAGALARIVGDYQETSSDKGLSVLSPESDLYTALSLVLLLAESGGLSEQAAIIRELRDINSAAVLALRQHEGLIERLNLYYETTLGVINAWMTTEVADFLAHLENEVGR